MKKKNYFKKKGIAVEDLFELIFFMVVSLIAIYLFLFSSIVASSKEDKQVKLERDKIELADDFLIYYATFPLGEDKKIADLILESSIAGDASELERITKEILNDYFPNQNIAVEVKDHLDNTIIFVQEGSFGATATKPLGEIALPSYNIDGKIESFKVLLYQIKRVTI